ncbi:uncharacterized protein LOC121263144 [Juglans microcarpa x Juglans regia]|uniref:uncharacterized protein LOC121263144 n=1 Tax=Juglans microcarpa x Juglans regia TaxID=2249226 RepID=UPI001B7F4540|nr:uncharacterized protein LOC121263144 [Juglans microcarpa x Juglans regia]
MSMASSQQSFLTNALSSPPTHKPRTKILYPVKTISCRYPPHDHNDSRGKSVNQLGKLAIVTLAAGVLTLGSVHDASAAKSGGRVGGQAFRPSAPRSAPRINNNSRTNIYVNPPVAPPLVGGYGYGYGYGVPFYGGWGWSPFSFFAPGPSVAVGVGGGFDFFALLLFLGAITAVARRFTQRRDEDD